MTERFADSFVFLAMLNRGDRKHAAAVAALSNSRDPLVTTAWVMTELADGLCSKTSRPAFVSLETSLRTSPRVTIIPANSQLYDEGLDL